MTPTNPKRNGNQQVLWTILLSLVSLVVGLSLGAMRTRLDAEQRFVAVDVYRREQASIGHKLDRIEQKLDELTRAVERNSVMIGASSPPRRPKETVQ